MQKFSKDNLALGLAVCAFLLSAVFFYGLWRNVSGLSQEVAELTAVHSTTLELDRRSTTLDSRIADLQALPRRTTTMALEQQIRAMAHATGDLNQQLKGKHRDKLERIQTLLREIGDDLHEQK